MKDIIPGQSISHYRITEKLGEGGMGVVYKAQDTKLDRFVALKFLSKRLTETEEEKSRFIKEAKASSSMNHPNVCTIHEIEEHNGQLFIVMEFVDGKTLKTIVETHRDASLPTKQILDIGIQVAEGLAAAHEKGIAHRDIKPENIMVRKDGIAQIMDFGLAKLYLSGSGSRLTKTGTTVGTLGYMSPEQVQGLDVDHRTDIFSLGVVLYELFAGESPFKGMHETAIMYEIVNVEPQPISTIKEAFDPLLDDIILECLEKDKDERCQSAMELAKNLRKVKKSTGHRKSRVYSVDKKSFQTQPVSKSSDTFTIEVFNRKFDLRKLFTSLYLLWGVIVILLLAIIYFELLNKKSVEPRATYITSILAPENIQLAVNYGFSKISHNGKLAIFGGTDSLGNVNLFLRSLNSVTARKLEDTQGAIYSFWSYDDKYIFFFQSGKLKKMDINSGGTIDICNAAFGRGGTENKSGQIVFAPNARGGLYMVSANGGTPTEIIKSNPGNNLESLRYPYFLPDGKHFLYTILAGTEDSTSGDVLKIGSTDSKTDKTIMNISSNAEYANGYLFFVRNKTLMCQAFDLDNYELSGDIHTISRNLAYYKPRIYGAFSLSTNGNLLFQKHFEDNRNTVLTDSKGNIIQELFSKKIEGWAVFSPDGSKIAYTLLSNDNKKSAIWIYDLNRKFSSRITFGSNYDVWPIWSPDGKYIAYTSFTGSEYNIFVKKADGTGRDSLIYQSKFTAGPASWSRNGEYILFDTYNTKTKFDVGIIDLKNNNQQALLLNTNFFEQNGKLSKDMKWIMYSSDESGKSQIYVKPFGSNEGKWQVSNNSGLAAEWVDNDKAIIYMGESDNYKVSVDGSGKNFIVGKSEKLFNKLDKNISNIYDVTGDGKFFLCDISNNENLNPPIIFVQNWHGLIAESEK